MKLNIQNAVVLIEFETKEFLRVVIKAGTLKIFLEGVAAKDGILSVMETPIKRLALEPVEARII